MHKHDGGVVGSRQGRLSRQRGGSTRDTRQQPAEDGPTLTVILGLLAVEGLLMAFSICAAILGQSSLAVMGGTAFVTLAGDIVRRFLTYGTARRERPPDTVEGHRPVERAGGSGISGG
ncbi:hypothetical protein RB614_03270 [Phytohabitans sp. ZYX-F-186]|uniref:Uncharacterized protein n=1 Tax=Phytohabitans maris TaxID=3071409 RepID=A0ABU0Z962_9ACTN|nr:hypothetical protein [Phytohabitans sp. ZYX-F-186]MDQ7903533.1 hypothetical protein [Phytohabitans sp. ZYX-F-186]